MFRKLAVLIILRLLCAPIVLGKGDAHSSNDRIRGNRPYSPGAERPYRGEVFCIVQSDLPRSETVIIGPQPSYCVRSPNSTKKGIMSRIGTFNQSRTDDINYRRGRCLNSINAVFVFSFLYGSRDEHPEWKWRAYIRVTVSWSVKRERKRCGSYRFARVVRRTDGYWDI